MLERTDFMDRNHLPLNITEKLRARTSFIGSVIVLIVLSLTLCFADYSLIEKPARDAANQAARAERQAQKEASENYVKSAHVVAAGNNVFDTNIYQAGISDTGVWNYDFLYDHVREKIQSADLAIVSQSTPLTQDHNAVVGYPTYRSPAEAADALINAGFDIIASASCHADDYGAAGITETLNVWNSKYPNIPILGIHSSAESANTAQIVTVNDIRIALLNYTYGTNTSSLSSEEAFMLDTFDKDKIAQAVSSAKSQSDCVIFIAHWGETDETAPSEYQKQWATYLMNLGVNVIIGTHPMTVQPYGTMTDDLGNETTVFYSLGHFAAIEEVSSRLVGGIADFTIEKEVKNGESSIRISNRSLEPLVMHYNYSSGEYGPYLLDDYTDALAGEHSMTSLGYSISLSGLQEQFDTIMSANVTPTTDLSLVNGASDGTADSDAADTVTDVYEQSSDTTSGITYDANGGYYDSGGNYYDAYGNVYTSNGYYDAYGNFYSY